MAEKSIAILGTGMAGFGAADALEGEGIRFACYDKNGFIGGHTHSFRYESGFVFDEGGHISFTKHQSVKDVLADSIKGKFEERRLRIDNYWHGRRIPHPVQTNLHGLPTDLIIKIVEDFVAATSRTAPDPRTQTYAEWLHTTYGRTFAETFPIVYGTKYHTTTMDRLVTDWIGPRMYRPTLEQVLRGAFEGSVTGAHYVDTFRYPSFGGFMSYLEPLAERCDVKLDHELVGIDTRQKQLRFENGAVVPYTAVISSIPLPDLVPLIDAAPHDVIAAARALAFTTAVLFNFGIDRDDLSETAITYFYDEDIVFSRLNLPHMFSQNNAPPGCGTIQAEIYFSDKYKPLTERPERYVDDVVAGLRRCGFIRETDRILMLETAVNRYANVIYDRDRAEALRTVHGFLDEQQIRYCGRYGNWDHSWTDESFISGGNAARKVLAKL
jgi:protoporphyrinogen oxidase